MATKTKRVTITPDVNTLATLGYSVGGEAAAAQLTQPLWRFSRMVERATTELAAVLDRREWNAICDVMNGCADMYDYFESDVPALLMVRANLGDAEGIAEKWGIDVADLCRRLETLTPLHGEAILCATRWAWSHANEWDHAHDEWWTPAFRRQRSEKLAKFDRSEP